MSDIVPVSHPHISTVVATPFPDGRRVGVSVDVADTTEPCNLDIEIRTAAGRFLGSMFVVELREPHVDITIHYRVEPPTSGEQLVAQATLLIGETETDRASSSFMACVSEC